MERYNSKTSLFIDYQFPIGECATESIDIISQEFDTFKEAWKKFETIMPDGYDWDDGSHVSQWNQLISNNEEDVFWSFVKYVDKNRYFLAYLRPVLGKEINHG